MPTPRARRPCRGLLVAVGVLAITITGIPAAVAAPISRPASPAAHPSPPVSSFAALTTIPDFSVNPVMLRRLNVQLSAADIRAARARHAYLLGVHYLARATASAHRAAAAAAAAAHQAAAAQQTLDAYAVSTYESGGSGTAGGMATLLSMSAGSGGGQMLTSMGLVQAVGAQDAAQLTAAANTVIKAKRLAAAARRQATAVAAATNRLRRAAQAAQTAVTAIRRKISALFAQMATEAATAQAVTAQAGGAVARWKNYLTTLGADHIIPPSAAQLANPAHLPPGFLPVYDTAGHPQPGVAKVHTPHGTILVLPREVIIAVGSALSKLGKPYVWGGTGPVGYDCSGLTMTSYQAAGVSIPRTSQAQYLFTTPVAPGQELPGDLVYFVGSGDGGTPAAPGHVGIVLDPIRHLFIQAPQPGQDVQISRYTDQTVDGFGRVSTTISAPPPLPLPHP